VTVDENLPDRHMCKSLMNCADLWPLGVEEGRLEDAEGDHDLVHHWRIEGVHLLGRGQPPRARHNLHKITKK
jgi:hypothetical protein